MFTNLAALSALIKKDDTISVVSEARDASADFDGIKSVIADNFADLEDNLGKSGKLVELMKSTGVDKLDVHEDESGRTIAGRIEEAMKAIVKAKRSIMSALDEMELMVVSVPKKTDEGLNESVLTEGRTYDDSSEFTEDLHSVGGKILDLKKLIRQPRWMQWMEVTDHNFNTTTVAFNKELHDKLVALDGAYNNLEAELLRAE